MYKSRIDGRDIIPERYIVELISLKLAKVKKIKLEYGFWNEEDWKSYYKFQIRLAYQLTAMYPHEQIVKALDDPECYVFTLRDDRLVDFIKKYKQTKTFEAPEVKTFGTRKEKSNRENLGDL